MKYRLEYETEQEKPWTLRIEERNGDLRLLGSFTTCVEAQLRVNGHVRWQEDPEAPGVKWIGRELVR